MCGSDKIQLQNVEGTALQPNDVSAPQVGLDEQETQSGQESESSSNIRLELHGYGT